MKIKADVNAYSEVPEGTATIHQAWSGDPIAGQYYLPKGETPDVLGYWRPDDPKERVIGSDNIAIPKSAKKPVLAHLFINDLLDNKISLAELRLERLPTTAHEALGALPDRPGLHPGEPDERRRAAGGLRHGSDVLRGEPEHGGALAHLLV